LDAKKAKQDRKQTDNHAANKGGILQPDNACLKIPNGQYLRLNFMHIIRTSRSRWQGSGKEGSGWLNTESPALKDAAYSYESRFGNAPGTNPEELVAAAHAGCFNMRLASLIAAENLPAAFLETFCSIHLEEGSIVRSHLILNAKGSGIFASDFARLAEEARISCPMSRLLKAEISLEFTFISTD
jgi:osmotically inducible protein OsmC